MYIIVDFYTAVKLGGFSIFLELSLACLFVTSLCWYELIVKVLQLARSYSGGKNFL